MAIDPGAYERERTQMLSQVKNLIRKYGADSANAISLVSKADNLYRARVSAVYDSPADARAFTVRMMTKQLTGKPATYEDITDSRVAFGKDTSNVRKVP